MRLLKSGCKNRTVMCERFMTAAIVWFLLGVRGVSFLLCGVWCVRASQLVFCLLDGAARLI